MLGSANEADPAMGVDDPLSSREHRCSCVCRIREWRLPAWDTHWPRASDVDVPNRAYSDQDSLAIAVSLCTTDPQERGLPECSLCLIRSRRAAIE